MCVLAKKVFYINATCVLLGEGAWLLGLYARMPNQKYYPWGSIFYEQFWRMLTNTMGT